MDGDRSVVDGRDILESELQELIREAFEKGWEFGDEHLSNPTYASYAERNEALEKFDNRLHRLLISYYDSKTSDVGAQDETD